MALNFVLETPVHKKRVLNTSSLVATFNSENQVETLVERTPLTDNERDVITGARDDIKDMRVDSIPIDTVRLCDLRVL